MLTLIILQATFQDDRWLDEPFIIQNYSSEKMPQLELILSEEKLRLIQGKKGYTTTWLIPKYDKTVIPGDIVVVTEDNDVLGFNEAEYKEWLNRQLVNVITN